MLTRSVNGSLTPGSGVERSATRRLRVLLFSTLYPSSARPSHGLFVQTRLQELLSSGEIDARVVAPVPWFPSAHPRFGDWARLAITPRYEAWQGIHVLHPRYALPPRVGQTVAPFVLAASALQTLRRVQSGGFDFDLIDAHYFYPDGVAAAWLGRVLRKPVVITARGSDLNVLGRDTTARAMMRWAATQAAATVGVCQALTDVLAEWGVPQERLNVIRNGVDLQRFRPLERAAARADLGLDGSPLLLSVGNLVPVKGHELTIEAVASLAGRLPGIRLVIVGRGALREQLEAYARERRVADLVHFAGAVANDQLARWYSAADMSILASLSEGWANVLLEAMACGTPVIASNVGGSAEVIGAGEAGVVMARRDVEALCRAIEQLHAHPIGRDRVRRYAEHFSWDATTAAQLSLFRQVVGRGGERAARALAPGPRH
jgi:teichuronic acid biosynthesis glycosyltransferase TuaC